MDAAWLRSFRRSWRRQNQSHTMRDTLREATCEEARCREPQGADLSKTSHWLTSINIGWQVVLRARLEDISAEGGVVERGVGRCLFWVTVEHEEFMITICERVYIALAPEFGGVERCTRLGISGRLLITVEGMIWAAYARCSGDNDATTWNNGCPFRRCLWRCICTLRLLGALRYCGVK